MLYDPKWGALTLESLIAWLEQQPAKKEYDYRNNAKCVLAQYLTNKGFRDVCVFCGGNFYHSGGVGNYPIAWNRDIALGSPRTFGAALQRARRLDDAE